MRCSLAAVLVSVIDRMTSRLGYGWTYVIWGGVCALLIPLMYAAMHFGRKWREERESRAQREIGQAESTGQSGGEKA